MNGRRLRRERGPLSARFALSLVWTVCACAGCASFQAVETTPEAILATINPADTVHVTLRDGREITLGVRSVSDEFLRGQPAAPPDAIPVEIRLDRIAALEVERPNLRKAMLTIFLPAVVGVAVICSHQDCRQESFLVATP